MLSPIRLIHSANRAEKSISNAEGKESQTMFPVNRMPSRHAKRARMNVLADPCAKAISSPKVQWVEVLEPRQLLSATVFQPTFLLRNPGSSATPFAGSGPAVVSPAAMRTAYGVDAAMFGSVAGNGAGQTIAIVDAFNEPTIKTDLAAFDSNFGIPAPPSFTQLNESGGATLPAADKRGGWGVETALDVEWAHVIAPAANILLVEASSAQDADLYAAVDTARNHAGVVVVSMSWGGDESSADSSANTHFTTPANHAGVTFVASSGDDGAFSTTGVNKKIVEYPAASPNVLSVGGTTLTLNANSTYASETGWGNGTSSRTSGGAGGGISTVFAQPSYQQGVVTQSVSFRTVPDVSLDADPQSGVPVYDVYDNSQPSPWLQVGGTSLAAPMWAGVIAIADQGRALNGLNSLDGRNDTLPDIYALPASDFHDVTTGNNGYAASPGYDLVTGRGTPMVNLVVDDLSGTPATPTPVIGSFTVAPNPVLTGQQITLTAGNVVENNGIVAGVNFYLESNGSAGLQTATDTFVGAGVQSGTTWTLGPISTGLSAGTYTYYAVAVDTSNVSSNAASALVTVQIPVPVIGSLSANPTSVPLGGTTTLTASNVTETGASVTAVNFYRESNKSAGLQTGSDTFVGAGVQNGSSWSIGASTAGLTTGTYTYYTVAVDNNNTSSSAASAVLTVVNAPTIGTYTINPNSVTAGASVTLTAGTVREQGGSIASVAFYRESNGSANLQIGSDTSVGAGKVSGTNWTLSTSTTGLPTGVYTYYAIATDTHGLTSVAASTTLSVTGAVQAGTPTIGSFAASPNPVTAGTATTLTAGNVTETNGTIIGVNFYLESNNSTGLQIGSDTLVGPGLQNGTTWSISEPTNGLSPGNYTFYAVATDAGNISSSAASTQLTVNSAVVTTTPITGTVLAWTTNRQKNFGTQNLAATTIATGATNSTTLTRGAGVSTQGQQAPNAWGGSNWAADAATGITGNQSITFGFTIAPGFTTTLSSITLNYGRNTTGPANGYWQYQLNGGAWAFIGDFVNQFSVTKSTGGAIAPVDLSGIAALQSLQAGSVVNFRVIPYGSTASTGTWYILDNGRGVNDLAVNAASSGGLAIINSSNLPTGASAVLDEKTDDVANWVFGETY